jgi:trafficking protein particle complex subunit 9
LDVLPETHSQIINLYERSLGSSSLEPAPPICLSDSTLRLARLLCDAYVTSGLEDAALRANVLGIQVKKSDMTYSKYPPKGEIARWAMRARSPSIEHESVPVSYRMSIITSLIHIMGTIGFNRRRAALLTELLHLLIPQLVQARVIRAAEWGLHPIAAQTLVKQLSTDDGLVGLLKSLTDVYGSIIPYDDMSICGWPSLKAFILKECIRFCDSLPSSQGVALFTSLLFAVAGEFIDKDEQIRLAGNLPRVIAVGRRKEMLVEANYWDPFVLQNIDIVRYGP